MFRFSSFQKLSSCPFAALGFGARIHSSRVENSPGRFIMKDKR